MEGLLCVMPCDKPLRFVIVLNAHNDLMRLVPLLPPDGEAEALYVAEKDLRACS